MGRQPSSIAHRPKTTITITKDLARSLSLCCTLSGETIGEYCERVFAPVLAQSAREGIVGRPARPALPPVPPQTPLMRVTCPAEASQPFLRDSIDALSQHELMGLRDALDLRLQEINRQSRAAGAASLAALLGNR